jgi:hypothetical protein
VARLRRVDSKLNHHDEESNMAKARQLAVEMERFKSYEAATRILLAPLTVILGRNNSGKSRSPSTKPPSPHFSPPRLLWPYLPEILRNTSSPLLGGLQPACGMRLRASPQSFSAASTAFHK